MLTPFLEAKGRMDEAASWLEDAGSDRRELEPEESLEAAADEVLRAMQPLHELGFESVYRGDDPVQGLPLYETVVAWPRAAEAHNAIDALYAAVKAAAPDDLPARAALAAQVRELIPGTYAAELGADDEVNKDMRDSCPF